MRYLRQISYAKGASVLLCGVLLVGVAQRAHAASITLDPPSGGASAGAPFTISMRLTTEIDSINAISGVVTVPEGVQISNLKIEDSVMRVWPGTPTYELASRKISFSGGVPGGIPPGQEGLLVEITAIAEKAGEYQFTADPIRAYRHDGLGTLITVPTSTVTIRVSAAGAGEVSPTATTSPDHTGPVFEYADIGRDPSLFSNNYFVTFQARDSESGVDYYEVKEGWFGSYVRSIQYYVLRDQSRESSVTVRAVDKAGNTTEVTLPREHVSWLAIVSMVIGAGVVLLILTLLYRRRAGRI